MQRFQLHSRILTFLFIITFVVAIAFPDVFSPAHDLKLSSGEGAALIQHKQLFAPTDNSKRAAPSPRQDSDPPYNTDNSWGATNHSKAVGSVAREICNPHLCPKGTGKLPAQAFETTSATTKIPTLAYTNGEQQILAPDWSQITWGSLPPIEEPGWIQFPPNFVKKLGYDPSRSWLSGVSPDQFVMLGDMQDAFHLEAFTLEDISGLTELAMETLSLDDFGLTYWQSPQSLVEAIPELGKLPVAKVAPIRDLLKIEGGWSNDSIAQVLELYPTKGSLPLEKLDLKQYDLKSIPGLTQTPLGKFASWQQSSIAQVPGLNQVPFSQFPIPLIGSSISLGITDVVWSAVEHGDPKVEPSYFISGTVNKKDQTVPVPCEAGEPCAYIELTDPASVSGPLHGKRWVSGKVQQVKGGFGPLAAVNGGWEPAGKLVYGSAFKVVLTNTNESKGTADFALYLRACVHIPFYGKSCTPYFIGGIPWFPTNEKGFVIVASTEQPNVNIASKYQEQLAQISEQNQPKSQETQAQEPIEDGSGATQTSPTYADGSINQRIINAMQQAENFPTGSGYSPPETDNGNNACAWAVNQVIAKAGIPKLGGNTLAVNGIEAALQGGRGERIDDRSQARAGDIALIPGKHVGICLNNGCTQIKSNSSSRASFSWISDAYFSPSYRQPTRVYRVRS